MTANICPSAEATLITYFNFLLHSYIYLYSFSFLSLYFSIHKTKKKMDTLKRRHNVQTPDSPPPKYSDTYEPVPVSDEHFSPSMSEKDGKAFRKNYYNYKVIKG